MSTIPLLQPLQQSTLRVVINLLLAPLGGLLAIYFPLFLLVLLLSTQLSSALPMAQMILFILSAACIFYFIFLFLPLMVCMLLLRYFGYFNILSICLVALLSHLICAYLSSTGNLSNVLISLSFFSIPTAGFYLFLTMWSHRIYLENSE